MALALRARLGRAGVFPVLVAAVAGLAVFAEARGWLARQPVSLGEPQYLRAVRDLPADYAVRFSDLTSEPASRLAQAAPVGALTDQDLVAVKGARLVRSLSAGAFLQWDALILPADNRVRRGEVPKGRRAYEVALEDAFAVEPSDRVDVWMSAGARGATPLLVIEGATVLAVRRSEEGPRALLSLAPDEVVLVEKAQQRGKLKLSLRSPDEAAPRERRGARLPVHPTGRRVEIWSEAP